MAKDYRQADKAHVWHPLFQHQRLEETPLAVMNRRTGQRL